MTERLAAKKPKSRAAETRLRSFRCSVYQAAKRES